MENRDVQILFISGMSGAGKTQAMRALEDMGYFCIDNLPASLILDLVDVLLGRDGRQAQLRKVAIAVDVRGKDFLEYFQLMQDLLTREGIDYQVLFLDAANEVLINRYKESRRRHPLQDGLSMEEALRDEREMLQEIRGYARRIIDTSKLSLREFSGLMFDLYGEDEPRMLITVESFGFKYGLPRDADLVMDVRFLPNPFYDPVMRSETGEMETVRNYVMGSQEAMEFLSRYTSLLSFLVPQYIREGKRQLVIAIGCTGGQHRSVVLAEELASRLPGTGIRTTVIHRDLKRASLRREPR